MKLYIQASELVLDAEEMRKQIPSDRLAQLEGAGGVLQAYRLAHEGISRPRDLTRGQQILAWPRAVIHRLTQKIQAGTRFFVGHGEGTNSHDGRKSVGEVVASFVKEIGGKLSSIIIGHFPDRLAVDGMDVCSMEADVHTEGDVVGDVNTVTGVALGNSRSTSPAFPGATLLSTLQCFDNNSGEGDEEVADTKITFDDIKRAVRDMNIYPWQLYTVDDIKNDKTFGALVTRADELAKENEKLAKANEEITKNSKEALRKGEVAEATSTLDRLLSDGFTDKQRSYIKKRFDPAAMEDLSEDAVSKFVEEGKKDFAETARLFGVSDTGDSKKTSSSSSENNGASKDSEDGEKSLEDQALEIVLGKE